LTVVLILLAVLATRLRNTAYGGNCQTLVQHPLFQISVSHLNAFATIIIVSSSSNTILDVPPKSSLEIIPIDRFLLR
jgi:hypothetical protein